MRLSPGLPEATVSPGREIVRGGDGRLNVTANVTISPERLDEYRHGYRCLMCHAAQKEAFPAECVEWYCRYPMRDRQADDFAREYQGEHDPWPTHRADEPDDAPAGWRKTDSNIVVPKGIT